MADNTNEAAVSTLNELIETARDGQKGFQAAANDAEHADLKSLFNRLASQRGGYVTELSPLVTSMGGEPDKSGSVSGAAHRGWIAVKTAVAKRDDASILEECERGEDYAKKAWNEAVASNLPAAAMSVVTRQAGEVRKAHDEVRDLRNAVKAAR